MDHRLNFFCGDWNTILLQLLDRSLAHALAPQA
jgi:hypothetical protein